MGGFLGALAGGGMLLLIGALLFTFLQRIGAMGKGQLRRLGVAAGMTLGAGMLYWLLGGLFYAVLREPAAELSDIRQIFRGAGLDKMYAALESPSYYGVLSGLFAYLGHGLGRLLFGRYLLGGVSLAAGMTLAAVCLVMSRLSAILGEERGRDGAFLLLCLPGAVYFFLPGWPSMALFIGAMAFYFLGRKIPPGTHALPAGAYHGLLGLCAVFSAAAVYGAVLGA